MVDSLAVESDLKEIEGIGLLKVQTSFGKEKILRRARGRMLNKDIAVSGYEIHHGITSHLNGQKALFKLKDSSGKSYSDGAVSNDGRVWGVICTGSLTSRGFAILS